MEKNLLDFDKILILLVAFILLNVTPACALQMQITPEQPKINNSRININIRAANNWFKKLPYTSENNYNTIQTQNSNKNVVNNKNRAYKVMNIIVKDNPANINVNVDRSVKNVSSNELIMKDRIDKANILQPKLKAEYNNATEALKTINVKYKGINEEYIASSAREIEFRNDLKNYITTTKNPGEYWELKKQCELIHSTTSNLHSDLNTLETQRKKLKIEIIYLKKGLDDLEQIQSLDQKIPNQNINPIINNFNYNINAIKTLNSTETIGINTYTTTNNKSLDKSVTNHEISADEQLNDTLKTFSNEPQEPLLDVMLYTSVGIGIPGYFLGIVFNAARFLARSKTIRIYYTKIYIESYKNTMMELAEQAALDESLKATKARLRAFELVLAEKKAKLAASSAEAERLLKITQTKIKPALETETIKKTDAFVDASSSGTRTELVADVASTSGVRTELVADVASSSGVRTELISGVASSSGIRTELISGVASSSETAAATGLIENVESTSKAREILTIISDAEMEEYLAAISTEQAAINTLFYTRIVMYTCISLMVIAAICLVTWFGFKMGWWRNIFG